ncbi:MAG: histidine phosphatase family protein [Acidimicrobiales bacterium]
MLILVRHGETAANAAHLLQGRADLALDDLGQQQARALRGVDGGASLVVCSPLLRARQTAAAFRGERAKIVIDERWVEIDYGDLDGRPVAEAWAPLWARWRDDPDYVPPGGESLAAVGRRVRAACDELAEAAATGDVVVVTHVSPIKAAVVWALGVGDEAAWRMFCDPASVTRLTIAERGPVLRSFNEVHHLAALDQG